MKSFNFPCARKELDLIKASFLNKFQGMRLDEKVLTLCFITIFLPFPVTIAGALLASLYVCFDKIKRNQLRRLQGVCFLVLFGGLALVIPAMYQRWLSVFQGLAAILLLCFGLLCRTTMTKSLLHRLMDLGCILSVPCLIYAIVQKLWIPSSLLDGRASSVFYNPNYYGTILEYCILISFYRIMTCPSKKWWYLAVIGLSCIGIYLCDCISARPAVFLGCLVMLIYMKRFRLFTFVLAASVLYAVAALIIPGVLCRLPILDRMIELRVDIWETAAKGFLQHPLFGQGTFTYQYIWPDIPGSEANDHSHSLYLEPLLNYGIVGTSALLSYFGLQYRSLWHSMRDRRESYLTALLLGLTVSTLVHGISDVTVAWVQTGMLFLLLLSSTECLPVVKNRTARRQRKAKGDPQLSHSP